jgi:hypothetical protein
VIWIAISISGAGARAGQSGSAQGRNQGARVALEMVTCPETLAQAVRQIVGIEIGDLLVEEGSTASNVDRITIRCDGDLAWIEAGGDEHADRVDRTLRLADFPGDAAPRAVALAAIEELAALSPAVRRRIQERRTPAPPPVARAVGPATGPGEGAAGLPQVRWRVELAAVARAFLLSSGLIAYGGGLGVGRDLEHRGLVALDLDVAGGSRTVSLGEARGLQLSAGVLAGARAGTPDLSAALAIGARFGVVQFAGNPVDAATIGAHSVLRPWGGPVASIRGLAGVGTFNATLSLEAGFALVGAEGLADSAVALVAHGPWLGASLGIGIRR